MKIKITDAMKDVLTLNDMQAVKVVRNYDGWKEQKDLDWEARMAALVASDSKTASVLKYDVEIAKNERIWDYYGDGSRDIDIWLTVYAYDITYGFYRIGAYLSDIWSVGADNRDEIKQHMYILHYTEDGKKG